MKRILKMKFPLVKQEENILGEKIYIPVVGVNQMYVSNKRGSKSLSREADIYISHLLNCIEDKYSKFINKKYGKHCLIVYKFNILVRETKKGEVDQRYVRDTDNLIKPVQDLLEKKNIILSDKQARTVLGDATYNQTESPSIELIIYEPESRKEINKIFSYIETLVKS